MAVIRSGLRSGLSAGIVNIFLALLGVTSLAGAVVAGWFHLASTAPGTWTLLLAVALWGGAAAARRKERGPWRESLLSGLLAGAAHGLAMGAFTWGVASLVNAGTDLRAWLAQLTAEAVRTLTLGRSPALGGIVMFAALTAAGVVGSALAATAERYRWRESLRGGWDAARTRLMAAPGVQQVARRKMARYVLYTVALLILFTAPRVLGQYWNYTLGTVGIYVMLGLGLNIVVGLAGLLDLGYVAFFAIGAYTVALLTAPEPHAIQMNFWLALPLGVAFAALSGILLGIPVLRMRGDYLAIVTLGFGEIIRILSKSDALSSLTGGPRGVRDIAGPSLFGFNLNTEFYFMYFIILGIILVAFLTHRLQNSRVGRAWMAMRDDEDVAEAMGIYTLKYKLLAFAIGAAFAGLGGVLAASRNKFAGPDDFTLLVSINVLCLVIIGGMGSIPGVILGALVLKGLPELLRELENYRMLAFGALLIVMMILRPEGLWPSKQRKMELKQGQEPAEEVEP